MKVTEDYSPKLLQNMKFLFPLGAFFFFHKIIINLWMTYEDSLASILFAAQYVFTLFHEKRLNTWEDDHRFT